MKCSICGRQLRHPKSKELGYGPVCYKRKFGTIQCAGRRNADSSAGETADYNLPGQISVDDFLQMLSGE